MQKVVVKQTLAFEDGLKLRGDVVTVHNSVAKQLKDNGLVDFVGDETDEQPEQASAKNTVTFSDEKGKKLYETGTTEEHVKADKAKPSAITETKKEKAPKEK